MRSTKHSDRVRSKSNWGWSQGLLFLALFIGVCFFALKPLPGIDGFPLPTSLNRFSAEHDFLQNVLAFLALGYCSLWVLSPSVRSGFIFTGLCLFVIGLETSQRVLPHRVFDGRDIGAGIAGALLAWLIFSLRNLSKRPTKISTI